MTIASVCIVKKLLLIFNILHTLAVEGCEHVYKQKAHYLRLQDPVCSWLSTAHAHRRFSMDFELTPLVLLSIFFFTINSVQCLWIWRDLVTNVLFYGQCRAWQSHFKNIIGCCNFAEAKNREVCTDSLDKRLFLKNGTTLPAPCIYQGGTWRKKLLISSLSVVRLVRFWFKSLQSLTAHDRHFLQSNLFLPDVCTHKVPLYLCSIICSRSQVQVSTVSYHVLSAEHVPNCIP